MVAGDGEQDGDRISTRVLCNIYGRSVMIAEMLEVSIRSRNGALRLEKDAWSMVE